MNTESIERLNVFMESRISDLPEPLFTLEQEALHDGVPVIRPATQQLIRLLIELRRPAQILEIGTAVGFSSLLMAMCLTDTRGEAPWSITTLELDSDRARAARENFRRLEAGITGCRESRIHLIEEDAAKVLPELPGEKYDFILLDGPKGQYVRYLPELVRVLSPGGVLLTDNILKDGQLLKSKYAVPRRDRTIHIRMREYLDALREEKRLVTVLLETGDGAAVSVRK